MEKPNERQVAKVVLLLILLLFIPFVSSPLRHSYLYFLLNILILALALEAGFLRAISRPPDSRGTPSTAAAVCACPVAAPELVDDEMRKTAVVVKKVDPPRKGSTGLRRCPWTSEPSIFFIAGSGDGREVGSGVWKEEMSRQELFVKSEDFIGNFHMQLRMQREQSGKSKKTSGFYDHYRS